MQPSDSLVYYSQGGPLWNVGTTDDYDFIKILYRGAHDGNSEEIRERHQAIGYIDYALKQMRDCMGTSDRVYVTTLHIRCFFEISVLLCLDCAPYSKSLTILNRLQESDKIQAVRFVESLAQQFDENQRECSSFPDVIFPTKAKDSARVYESAIRECMRDLGLSIDENPPDPRFSKPELIRQLYKLAKATAEKNGINPVLIKAFQARIDLMDWRNGDQPQTTGLRHRPPSRVDANGRLEDQVDSTSFDRLIVSEFNPLGFDRDIFNH